MRAVGIEHLPFDHAAPHRLQHDLIEDLLINGAVGEATTAILRQGRRVWHLLSQAEIKEPAVGDVDLNFAHELPFAADAKQVAYEEQLEEHNRIKCRSAIVGTVKVRDPVTNESEIDRPGDLAQQVVGWH